MNFLLAGEGSSDLGALSFDGTLKKGAMTLLIDTIAEKKLRYNTGLSACYRKSA